jgi:hypothetical protein
MDETLGMHLGFRASLLSRQEHLPIYHGQGKATIMPKPGAVLDGTSPHRQKAIASSMRRCMRRAQTPAWKAHRRLGGIWWTLYQSVQRRQAINRSGASQGKRRTEKVLLLQHSRAQRSPGKGSPALQLF